MHRVSEHRIWRRNPGSGQRGHLPLVRRHIQNSVRHHSVLDRHPRRQHAIGANSKSPHTLFDHPVVGRTHRPDLHPLAAKRLHQFQHLREDVSFNPGLEEDLGRPPHLLLAQPLVHLHHLSADCHLRHLAAQVSTIANVHPIRRLPRDQPRLDRPLHKRRSGIPRPQCSVAIKNRNRRGQRMNLCMEL